MSATNPTETYVLRLRALRKRIETSETPINLGQYFWGEEGAGPCGAPACVAGHAAVMACTPVHNDTPDLRALMKYYGGDAGVWFEFGYPLFGCTRPEEVGHERASALARIDAAIEWVRAHGEASL